MNDPVAVIKEAGIAAARAQQHGCVIDVKMGSGRSRVEVLITPNGSAVQFGEAPPVVVGTKDVEPKQPRAEAKQVRATPKFTRKEDG